MLLKRKRNCELVLSLSFSPSPSHTLIFALSFFSLFLSIVASNQKWWIDRCSNPRARFNFSVGPALIHIYPPWICSTNDYSLVALVNGVFPSRYVKCPFLALHGLLSIPPCVDSLPPHAHSSAQCLFLKWYSLFEESGYNSSSLGCDGSLSENIDPGWVAMVRDGGVRARATAGA